MEYSRMLKEIIRSSHWTQEQLAAKLGVSFATVNAWINGRTKPQKSLMPDIRRLYMAQDVTNEAEPVYITLVNTDGVRVGDYVLLKKDTDNGFDDEAIEARIMDGDELVRGTKTEDGGKEEDELAEKTIEKIAEIDWAQKAQELQVYAGILEIDGYERPMHVANSVSTVVRGTRSAGRIYDKFDLTARAQVVFVWKNSAIARITSWNPEKKA